MLTHLQHGVSAIPPWTAAEGMLSLRTIGIHPTWRTPRVSPVRGATPRGSLGSQQLLHLICKAHGSVSMSHSVHDPAP